MGDILIHIPQHIHIEYTIDNGPLTKRLLDLLNTMMLRSESKKEDKDGLLGLFSYQSELFDQITECALYARETDALRSQLWRKHY